MSEAGKWLAESSMADSWGGIAFLFILFFYVFGGSLGYGGWLRNAVFPRSGRLIALSDSFLFASLFLYLSAFILAALHGLAWIPRILYWLIFLPGRFLQRKELLPTVRLAWSKWPLFLLLAGLVFFVRTLTAALPAQHGDPLLYHLLGPRLWMEAGGFIMHPQLPNALLASSWECLYLWPQMLWFSAKPFFGLVEAQLFSQWLHLFLAWGGSALLVMRLFRGAVNDRWLPLVGFGALFVSGVQWTAPLAKNDVGIAFWCLGAIVFFAEGTASGSKRKGLFSGIFAGLAICGKITALLSLAPILGVLFLTARPWKKPRQFLSFSAIWLLGALLGAVPIYLRNFLLSGNPFFPLFPLRFPSPWMSPTWQSHFAQVHPSSPWRSLPNIFGRIPELMRESPWCVGGVLLLIAVLVLRKRGHALFAGAGSREKIALLAGSVAAYVIFVITQSTDIELRYLGASLMILAAGGIALLLRLVEVLPGSKWQRVAVVLICAAVFATSRLPLHILRKIWSGPIGVEFTRTHSAGEAKAWLRKNAEGAFTVVAGDNETYYLSTLAVTVLTERPDIDAATLHEKNLSRFVAVLCEKSHARYLLDARPEIGVEAKFGAAALAVAKVFSAQGANVYDMRILEAQTGQSSPQCR